MGLKSNSQNEQVTSFIVRYVCLKMVIINILKYCYFLYFSGVFLFLHFPLDDEKKRPDVFSALKLGKNN